MFMVCQGSIKEGGRYLVLFVLTRLAVAGQIPSILQAQVQHFHGGGKKENVCVSGKMK